MTLPPHDRLYVNESAGLEWLLSLTRCQRVALRIVHLSSTACEQNRWADFTRSVDRDLLFSLALGLRCLVLDCGSRRGRDSRACWMGLEHLRRWLHLAWGLVPPPSRDPGRVPARRSDDLYRSLPRDAVRKFERYRYLGPVDVHLEWECLPSSFDGRYAVLAGLAKTALLPSSM